MNKFDIENMIFDKLAALSTYTIFRLVLNELRHEKTCFLYIICLCILTSFSLLTITERRVSNKHSLMPFFILSIPISWTELWSDSTSFWALLTSFYFAFARVPFSSSNLPSYFMCDLSAREDRKTGF